MAKKKRQAPEATVEPLDNCAPCAGAKCAFCAIALPGKASAVCMACLRDNTVPCVECVNFRGKLRAAYVLHEYKAQGAAFVANGEPVPEGERRCIHCGAIHPDQKSKKDCTICSNQRWVFKEKAVKHA